MTSSDCFSSPAKSTWGLLQLNRRGTATRITDPRAFNGSPDTSTPHDRLGPKIQALAPDHRLDGCPQHFTVAVVGMRHFAERFPCGTRTQEPWTVAIPSENVLDFLSKRTAKPDVLRRIPTYLVPPAADRIRHDPPHGIPMDALGSPSSHTTGPRQGEGKADESPIHEWHPDFDPTGH